MAFAEASWSCGSTLSYQPQLHCMCPLGLRCLWHTCSNMPMKPHSLHATWRPQPLNACGKARTFDQRPSPLASAACCAASSSA